MTGFPTVCGWWECCVVALVAPFQGAGWGNTLPGADALGYFCVAPSGGGAMCPIPSVPAGTVPALNATTTATCWIPAFGPVDLVDCCEVAQKLDSHNGAHWTTGTWLEGNDGSKLRFWLLLAIKSTGPCAGMTVWAGRGPAVRGNDAIGDCPKRVPERVDCLPGTHSGAAERRKKFSGSVRTTP